MALWNIYGCISPINTTTILFCDYYGLSLYLTKYHIRNFCVACYMLLDVARIQHRTARRCTERVSDMNFNNICNPILWGCRSLIRFLRNYTFNCFVLFYINISDMWRNGGKLPDRNHVWLHMDRRGKLHNNAEMIKPFQINWLLAFVNRIN
jgi:hypothetical protein